MDPTPFMDSLLAAGIAQCSAAVDGSEGLFLALFMAGLTGGLMHCTAMCGPFVISQVQSRLEAVPASAMSELRRLTGGALVPYHLGRGTTYMGLGAVAALAAGTLQTVQALGWVAAALLGFAGLFFLGYALRALGVRLPFDQGIDASGGEGTLARAWGRIIRPLFSHPVGVRGYALGLALGFIPCGLLYGALAAAAASGEWLTAIFAMAAFWLGTVPALLGIGVAGGAILGRWPDIARQAAPVLLIVNATFLLYLASQLL